MHVKFTFGIEAFTLRRVFCCFAFRVCNKVGELMAVADFKTKMNLNNALNIDVTVKRNRILNTTREPGRRNC